MDTGDQLQNRYLIQEILGQGGMGSVYKAVDQSLGVSVAIKENKFQDDNFARQFKREAVILANLRHSNLPRVTDHFVIEGEGQYLVMDYIEGKNLREIIDREKQLDEFTVRKIGIEIADALDYLHSLDPPVIHRDIKPSNIKITPRGEVFLVDFGLAKQITGSQETTTGARGLTPGYSPPEQYGSARTDVRSDIYSLGATLYVSLTGQSPAEGMSRAMNKATLAPVNSLNRDVSSDLADVLEKALAVQPGQRYQTSGEFKEALQGYTAGAGESATIVEMTRVHDPSEFVNLVETSPRAHSEPTRLTSPKKRKLSVPLMILGALGILVVCAGLIFIGSQFVHIDLSGEETQQVSDETEVVVVEPTDTETLPSPPTPTQTEIPTEISTPTQEAQPEITFTPTLTVTPAATPQGGSPEIAIVSDRTGLPQIWLISLEGEDYQMLTDAAGGACQPAWSPDGQLLAYITPCEGNSQQYPGAGIYITNLDGSENYRLMAVPGGDFDPAWSPDGTKIVFSTLRESNRPQIWIYDFETGEASSLSNSFTYDIQPAWAPDSFHIAFVTTRSGSNTEIWVMDLNGEVIGEFSRNLDKHHFSPVWSADGESILYTQSSGTGGVPYLVTASWKDGSSGRGFDEERVAPANVVVPMREADYSPDMNWLVYEGYPDGSNHDIFLFSIANSEIVKLTGHQALEFDSAWRP